MKIGDLPEMLDHHADEETQVEIQHETGSPETLKLYIHQSGRTIVRVCKLKPSQIEINSHVYQFIHKARQ